VGVDEAGDDPAAGGDRVGTGQGLEGDPAVGDPDVSGLLLRQEHASDVEGLHGAGC
jgi:hypothetical protein